MATLPNPAIKIKRALRLAAVGDLPETSGAMLAALPAETVAALTARQLAGLLDAAWRLVQASKALAERAACDEGAVWDARAQRLRELAA